MGTFPISFHILRNLQILNNLLSGMPGISVGADHQVCPPPVGGGAEAVATDNIACLATSCCSGVFHGPPIEDFL
jgi:hypothetical protein